MTLFQTSPKLSAAEEHDYSIRARAGDLHARERLVTANLPFVVLCTKPFRGYGLSDDELVEEGVIGLIEAINRFDADKGYRLTTYAKFWIRHTLFKALNECGATIRLSDDKARKVVKLRKCIAEQRRWQNSRVQMQHICSLVGCSEEEARQLLSLSQLPDSLDMPYPTDDTDCASANTNLSHLADTFTKSIEDSCVEKDLAERIRKAVLSLK
ncbi:MAG: sigma-70 family RNA polymerase sigma factor, partial [Treponema sp.]|nr:sigma-70 family RNA polymerase sigma factor [Treponema sp.]